MAKEYTTEKGENIPCCCCVVAAEKLVTAAGGGGFGKKRGIDPSLNLTATSLYVEFNK